MMLINGFGVAIWLVWIMLGQICGWGVTKVISHDLPNFQAKIPPDDILRYNQFHAPSYHHLLTCPHDADQWFCGGHLAGLGLDNAESDLWLGCDKSHQP
jgi:hypothetical protein